VAGEPTEVRLHVPNEYSDASTVKLDVQLPPGFAAATHEAVPGWTVVVRKRKLADPVETDDGPIHDEVGRMTWTAGSPGDGIQPGSFQDFPISVVIPGKPGTKLTFKALQTYSNGEIVRWVGAQDGENPAAELRVVSADAATRPQTTVTTAPAPRASAGGGASTGLAAAGLALGTVGVLLGSAALVRSRTR
jgi:uncharacterized protein